MEEAVKYYGAEGTSEDAHELSEVELERLTFWDSDNRDEYSQEHWQCECGAMADAHCRWNGNVWQHHHGYPIGHVDMKNIHKRTFREELTRRIAAGIDRPDVFATTEY